jgi:uncharacterized protein (DUF2062 family)
MPKKLIKRWMPNREVIQRQKALRIFGSVLYNPNLWYLNRRSASGAFAIGLFTAFIPLPTQMLIAAGFAIAVGVNLPLSIALVWVTNPITMPVIFYCAYKLGAWVLHIPPQHFHFELTWTFLSEQMSTIAPPLIVGCIICGVVGAAAGYFGIHWLWRYSVVRSWQKRRSR